MARKRKGDDNPEDVAGPSHPPKKQKVMDFHHPNLLKPHENYTPFLAAIEGWVFIRDFDVAGCVVNHRVVDQDMKYLIRGLLSLIYDVQRMGYSLETNVLVADNLGFSEDYTIKVISLRLRSCGADDVARGDIDFVALRDFLMGSFFNGIQIPPDMQNLMDLLGEERACLREVLIKNHLALMSTKARRSFISQWHDIIPQYNHDENSRYLKACNELPGEWTSNIEGNKPFEQSFEKGCYTDEAFEQPRWFRNCIAHL